MLKLSILESVSGEFSVNVAPEARSEDWKRKELLRCGSRGVGSEVRFDQAQGGGSGGGGLRHAQGRKRVLPC